MYVNELILAPFTPFDISCKKLRKFNSKTLGELQSWPYNILRLFDVLPNFSFTASERNGNY